jgi:hypothetical protein
MCELKHKVLGEAVGVAADSQIEVSSGHLVEFGLGSAPGGTAGR